VTPSGHSWWTGEWLAPLLIHNSRNRFPHCASLPQGADELFSRHALLVAQDCALDHLIRGAREIGLAQARRGLHDFRPRDAVRLERVQPRCEHVLDRIAIWQGVLQNVVEAAEQRPIQQFRMVSPCCSAPRGIAGTSSRRGASRQHRCPPCAGRRSRQIHRTDRHRASMRSDRRPAAAWRLSRP
jgi:hypothetical protein